MLIMSICKFCNIKPSIKKSHIIPEFMYKHTYSGTHPKMVVADVELKEIGERQKGYHEPLLCVYCEQYFNENFEIPCVSFIKGVPNNARIGSSIKFTSTPQLELLLLSILWRASLATEKHWKGVNLGPHQDIIKRCLKKKTINSNYSFWVFLSTYEDGKIAKGAVSSVQELKVNGHNFYHFIASGVQFIMEISSHKLIRVNPEPMKFDREMLVKVCNLLK